MRGGLFCEKSIAAEVNRKRFQVVLKEKLQCVFCIWYATLKGYYCCLYLENGKCFGKNARVS